MAWKDQLRPASFRQVAFHVDSDDMTAGRRVQVFEYPQRDKPFAEDLGRAAREINITGYVIGADYMAGRDALLAALEAPGPGTLVHPWYGSLQVVAKPARVTHSQSDGGMCRFSLVFVEAGELQFPSSTAAPGVKTRLAAESLKAASADDFAERFSVDGLPEFVADDAVANVSDALATVKSVGSRVGRILRNPVDGLAAELGTLVRTPRDLAGQVMDLFSMGEGLAETVDGMFGDGNAANQRAVTGSIAATSSFPPPTRPPPTRPASQVAPARQQMIDNADAVNALMRRALLVQAASMAGEMDHPVYDDAATLRRDLTRALDAESLTADDTRYRALQDIRAAVHQDIGASMDAAARIRTVTPAEPLPAIVLAYDLYDDVERAGEIAARNKIRHPGFVPAEPIKVLSA